MEVADFSAILVPVLQTTRRHMPEKGNIIFPTVRNSDP
jgi:hypothetical protein